MTRAQWGGGNPPSLPNVPLPARHLFIHHSVTTGDEQAQCRQVRAGHLAHGYSDIAYTVMVGQSGTLYEGRDPVLAPEDVGGHTLNWNSRSFAICGLGNFENETPTAAMIDSMRWLIGVWRWNGQLTGDCSIDPHRGVFSTACPGRNMPMDAIRVPWSEAPAPAQLPPPPPPVVMQTFSEDKLRTELVTVRTDQAGNGWAYTSGAGKPVSATLQGPYPPKDGYWNHLRYRPTPSIQEREGKTCVTLTDGPPNVDVGVIVAVA